MSKDIVKDSIKCLANMEIENTTYQIARDIVLQELEEKGKEIERLNNIIKEVREYIKQTGQYSEDTKRFKVDVLEPNYLDILEILDKGE